MRYALAFAIGIGLLIGSAASGQGLQGPGERQAQLRLPQARTPLWVTLRTTQVREDDARGMFVAVHPPAVRALAGKTVTLAGFMMPLDAQTRGNHFLLSKYTPVCPFCPPGEPNEVVEVRTAQPITFTQNMVTVTGVFSLANTSDSGMFFLMNGATVR